MAGAKVIKGKMTANGKKFGIVVSEFNEFISSKLVEGAIDTITKHGGKAEDVSVVWVPGSFEVPVLAKKLVKRGKVDAVICLGVIIRGETPHFDYVASEAAKGIAQVAMVSDIPCVFGVITADNLEQALERAGIKSGNTGRKAAMTAIELCNLYSEI